MHQPPKKAYRIGLGSAVLKKNRLIFLCLMLLVLLLSGATAYAESKNHQIEKVLIEPFRNILVQQQVDAILSERQKQYEIELRRQAAEHFASLVNESSDNSSTTQATSTTTTEIIINDTPSNSPTVYYYEIPSTTTKTNSSTQTPQKSLETIRQEQDAWFEQKRLENQKLFEESSAKNAAESKLWYDQKVGELQNEYQQSIEDAKKQQEEWKKQHGF